MATHDSFDSLLRPLPYVGSSPAVSEMDGRFVGVVFVDEDMMERLDDYETNK